MLSGFGKHRECNKDYTKCYYCDTELISDTDATWVGIQTLIKDYYCKPCNKRTSVKQFLTHEIIPDPETNTISAVSVTVRYYTGYVYVKITEVRCVTPKCNRIHSFAAIDQDKFLNHEELVCSTCKHTNTFVQQSPCVTRNDIRVQRPPKNKTNTDKTSNTSAVRENNGSRFTPLAELDSSGDANKAGNGNIRARSGRQSKHTEDTDTAHRQRAESASSRASMTSDHTLKRGRADAPATPPRNKRRAAARTPDAPQRPDNMNSPDDASTPGARAHAATTTRACSNNHEAQASNKNGCGVESSLNIVGMQEEHEINKRVGNGRPSGVDNITRNTAPRSKRFPPIIATVPDISRSTEVLRDITSLAAQHKCTLATDKRINQVRIMPSTLEGRAAVIEALDKIKEAQYHTYGAPQERKPSKKVVAKGFMMGDFTESEIQANVSSVWGLQLERVVLLNNSTVVLIFSGDSDMRDIKSITTLMYQRVRINPYKVKPTAVTQCKRCMEFGHVKQYCGHTPREPYYTDTDENGNPSSSPEAARHCTMCRESGHTAVQARCPLFQKEIKRQRERRRKFAEERERTSAAKAQSPRSCQPSVHPSTHREVTSQVSYANAASSVGRMSTAHSHSVPQNQAYPQLPSAVAQSLVPSPAYCVEDHNAVHNPDVRELLINLMNTMTAGLQALLDHQALVTKPPSRAITRPEPTAPAATDTGKSRRRNNTTRRR